jgi:hypothetical protein
MQSLFSAEVLAYAPAAAELYRLGVSRRVIVARAEIDRGRHARHNRQALIPHGVPPAAIADFNFEKLSTYGEALGVLQWVNRIKSIVSNRHVFDTSGAMDFPARTTARGRLYRRARGPAVLVQLGRLVASPRWPDGFSERVLKLAYY